MGLCNMQNQDMSLILSTDAKPRLKWTAELHQRFMDAVLQLGGPHKATPKSLMRLMGIPGLTLYHLKSHLQKYRLGKNQQTQTHSDSKQEDSKDIFSEETSYPNSKPTEENSQITRALQVQMEVQRKLHQQIEVQRHLQIRIEAQGKYLQKVLKKAHETLSSYNSTSMGFEVAKAELSQLVSMVSSGCSSSMESTLTSSESSDAKQYKELKSSEDEDANKSGLPLLDQPWMCSDQVSGCKRKGSTITEGSIVDKGPELKKKELLRTLDLNSKYEDEQDLGQTIVDLNSMGRV